MSILNKFKTMVGQWRAKYGKVQTSPEIDQIFTSFEVLDELDYFYNGSDVHPLAILGLEPRYPLKSKFWQSIDLTPAKLANWIQWMQSDTVASLPPRGWRICHPQGELVGIIYAHEKVVVTFEEDGSVCVYPPGDSMKDRP